VSFGILLSARTRDAIWFRQLLPQAEGGVFPFVSWQTSPGCRGSLGSSAPRPPLPTSRVHVPRFPCLQGVRWQVRESSTVPNPEIVFPAQPCAGEPGLAGILRRHPSAGRALPPAGVSSHLPAAQQQRPRMAAWHGRTRLQHP
jgi:hypothetical protein